MNGNRPQDRAAECEGEPAHGIVRTGRQSRSKSTGRPRTDRSVQRRSAMPGKRQMCAACHGVTENIVQRMAGEQGAAAGDVKQRRYGFERELGRVGRVASGPGDLLDADFGAGFDHPRVTVDGDVQPASLRSRLRRSLGDRLICTDLRDRRRAVRATGRSRDDRGKVLDRPLSQADIDGAQRKGRDQAARRAKHRVAWMHLGARCRAGLEVVQADRMGLGHDHSPEQHLFDAGAAEPHHMPIVDDLDLPDRHETHQLSSGLPPSSGGCISSRRTAIARSRTPLAKPQRPLSL